MNPEPSRNGSHTDGPVLFKGSGRAVLTVFKFENWKEFLLRGDRPLTAAEVQRIEDAATLENFCIAGSITVEWPVVELEFHMDDFVGTVTDTSPSHFSASVARLCLCQFHTGRKKRKTPFIVSARQNFATIMHPFTVDKEWMRFLGDKDKIRLNGSVGTQMSSCRSTFLHTRTHPNSIEACT